MDLLRKKAADSKRRSAENALRATGLSHHTEQDEQLESFKRDFAWYCEQLEDLGGGMDALMMAQRKHYECSVKVWEVFETSLAPHPELVEKAARTGTTWQSANQVLRRSMNKVVLEDAINAVREVVVDMKTEVDKAVLMQDDALVDLDSYRRRIQKLDGEKRAEMQGKLDIALQQYQMANAHANELLDRVLSATDHALTQSHATMLAAQLELAAATTAYLEDCAQSYDPYEIETARARIREVVAQGGPDIAGAQESTVSKAMNIFLGKKTAEEYAKEDAELKLARKQQQEFRGEAGEPEAIADNTGAQPPPPPDSQGGQAYYLDDGQIADVPLQL